MSALLDSTPSLDVAVENVFGNRRYPGDGDALAVVDTGYAGFLGVPPGVFEDLGLDQLELQERTLVFGNGGRAKARGSYARLLVKQPRAKVYGFVETWEGLDEVVIGTEALSRFRLEIDYCLGVVNIQKCGRPTRP